MELKSTKHPIISSKRRILSSLLLLACAFVSLLSMDSCSGNGSSGTCHIEGTAPTSLNGKKIYLVPLFGPRDKAHVDSAVVTDGKFQMTTDTLMMAMLRVDLIARFGTQDLLIVTEKGTIHATIGALSHAGGTPLNDSLQVWKDLTEATKNEQRDLYVHSRKDFKDKAKLEAAKQKALDLQLAYLDRTRQLKANVKPSVLYDFFEKALPDSTLAPKTSAKASASSAKGAASSSSKASASAAQNSSSAAKPSTNKVKH